MKHLSIIVSGKVQGVHYRQSACSIALELGFCGFVRNEPNGSVYIEAEGEEAELQEFITWCKQGPPLARVSEVKCEAGELKNFSGFEIKR